MVELVTDYLEGRLSRSERRRFEQHLSACDGCTAYVEQMRLTLRALGKLEEKRHQQEGEGRADGRVPRLEGLLGPLAPWAEVIPIPVSARRSRLVR